MTMRLVGAAASLRRKIWTPNFRKKAFRTFFTDRQVSLTYGSSFSIRRIPDPFLGPMAQVAIDQPGQHPHFLPERLDQLGPESGESGRRRSLKVFSSTIFFFTALIRSPPTASFRAPNRIAQHRRRLAVELLQPGHPRPLVLVDPGKLGAAVVGNAEELDHLVVDPLG